MKFFVDSNIIIEALKKPLREEAYNLLKEILLYYKKKEVELIINLIVVSEVSYILGFKKKSSLNLEELTEFLNGFKIKNVDNESLSLFNNYLKTYNLKPNDALILATCKYYGIPYLLSLDEDFREACEKEGIVLIDSVEKLKEVLNKK